MNNPHEIPTEPDSLCITPWPRRADYHPTYFLSGLANWPGFPAKKYLVEHLDKKDRAVISAILTRHKKASASKAENNIALAGGQLTEATRDNNSVAAERHRRELSAMDIPSYEKALADLLLIEREAGDFSAELCEKLAEKRWPEFEGLALEAEARLIQYGEHISEKNMVDGYEVETFELHGDVVLKGVFVEIWHLQNGWPVEFRSPKYSPVGAGLGWLRDLVSEG